MNYLEQNRDKIFKKYSEDELLQDIRNFANKGRLNKFLNHFFEEEMFKCKGGRGKHSPMEVLENNELVNKILDFTRSKPKFYTGDDVANIKSFFRNAGRIAQKVANFPVRQALEFYQDYSELGDSIYDPSCGFGSRLSACLLSGRNYYGTDPNKSLVKKLNEAGEFIVNNVLSTQFLDNTFKIYEQGSEVFIPELENNIDLCFTSPPYFDLEDYGNDSNQSIIKFSNIENWLEGFVKPTVSNCIKYTKTGGYIMFNIKNMTNGKKHKLFDMFFNELNNSDNMEFVEVIDMKQLSKRDYKGKHFTGVNTDFGVKEPVMVFKKK